MNFDADTLTTFILKTYDAVTGNVPGLGSAKDLANEYLKKEGSLDEKIDSLIRWQCGKTFTAGAITGIGGFITMPVTIPTDIASTFYVHLRMISAIAYMRGYDLNSDQTRTLVLICLCGDGALEILRKFGVKVGESLTKKILEKISGKVLIRINKTVGFKLFTKAGQKGLINFAKAVPIVASGVGGAVNIMATNEIGKAAKKLLS